MAISWTPAQENAITSRNKTLLISAAAGSGKTATLTERIIRSITDKDSPADISKMLIVTFTRASAADLKLKIQKAINEALAKNPADKHLNSQLIKLGSAKICTIDSFYLDLLRSNFAELELPPAFRIADTAEVEILEKEVMRDVVDFFYDTNDEFPAFCECFSNLRNTEGIIEVFTDLARRLSSVPEGIEFLKLNAEKTESDAELDFFLSDYGKVVKKQTADAIRHFINVFAEGCDYLATDEKAAKAYLPSFEYQLSFCRELLNAVEDPTRGYNESKLILEGYDPPKAGSLKSEFTTEETAIFKELRKDITDSIRKIAKNSFSKSPETIRRAMHDTARYTMLLYCVLAEFHNRLDEEKKKRNFLDFGDIRRYTLKLLVNADGTPTPIALQYAESFSHIYIDEYQDVDKVQDLIFSAISKSTNRFMVGDIKQSIYSFRGAEPQVFSSYRAAFPDYTSKESENSDFATLFMSNNFRCDENVILFTNAVCSYIFSACEESIGYRRDDDLVFSKGKPYDDYISPKAQVAIITLPKKNSSEEYNEDEMPDTKTAEAQYIAAEINRLIKNERKANGEKILPGDIAVLFRSRSMSKYLSEELAYYGILTSENDSDKYFENPDVLMMLCILNAVDNPQRDIFLAGALRSPIFNVTMDELIRIRNYCSKAYSLYDCVSSYSENENDALAEKCKYFITTLDEWRQVSRSLPADRFIKYLFSTDLFLASGLVNTPTEQNGGNLLRLYEYARSFENGSFKGLYQFIEFINTLIEEEKMLESPPMTTSPDRVSLMTIHQSKGLEFPVCFVCGTASKFNTQEQKESLLFEYPLGVAMKISESDGFARINTPMREAILKSGKTKQTEEEMRVLYVALTRARERLYVTAATKRTEEALCTTAQKRAMFRTRHTILSCTSYLDWILMALCNDKEQLSYSLNFIVPQSIEKESIIATAEEVEELPIEETTVNQELFDMLREKFAYRYPYEAFRRIPSKISVSKLSPDVLDEFDDSLSIEKDIEDGKKIQVPDFFVSGKISQTTPAERGIATHLFLQFCDFKNALAYGVDAEIARLVDKKFIPSNMANILFKNELEKFFESDFVKDICAAKQIIREQRFNILLPASSFTANKDFAVMLGAEMLAAQGVIDLILIDEEDNISVYDYKTDRLTKEEMASCELARKKMNKAHAMQLSYYAKAIEELFGRPCHKLCVYSTQAAKLFDIEKISLSLPDSIDTL
jgi:ATP-dependent helicase/nuclease subunit A